MSTWKHVYKDGQRVGLQEYDDAGNPVGNALPIDVTPEVAEGGGITQRETPAVPEYKGTSGRMNTLDKLISFGQDIIEPSALGIGGAAGSRLGAAAATRLGLTGLGASVASGGTALVAATLASLLTQKAQEAIPSVSGVPHNFTPSLSRAAAGAIIDRVTGKATDIAIGAVPKIRAIPTNREKMINKLGDILPMAREDLKAFKDGLDYAARYDAPTPTIFGLQSSRLKDVLASSISTKHLTELGDATAKSYGKAWDDLIKAKSVTILDQRNVAEGLRTKGISAYKAMKGVENAAWKKLDAVTNLSNFKAKYVIEEEVPSGMLDVAGNPLPPVKQLVEKFVDIKGPVAVENPQAFAQVLADDAAKLFQNPAEYFINDAPMRSAAERVKKFVGNLLETPPDMNTGKVVTPFANVKEFRGALTDIIDNVKDAQAVGAARKLRSLLSEATEKSIDDADLNWFPGSKTAYQDANKATMLRRERFGSEIGQTFSTPKSVTDMETFDTLIEKRLENALKTSEGAEQLVNAVGDNTEVASMFINNGFKHAKGEGGLIDGKKFKDYFFDGATNESIYHNNNIISADQRKVIRQLANYASSAKASSGGGLGNWQYAYMLKGALGIGAGTATGLITGSLPAGVAISGGLVVGLPLTRKFVENVILDKEGAKILVNRLHPTSPAQASKNTKRLIKLLGFGAKVHLINSAGVMFDGRVDENGKIRIEPQE